MYMDLENDGELKVIRKRLSFEDIIRATSTTTQEPNTLKKHPFLISASFFFAIIFGFFAIFYLITYCRRRHLSKQAQKSTPLLDSARLPDWFHQEAKKCTLKTTKLGERIKLYTKPYVRKLAPRSQLPCDEVAIRHLQVVLNDIFDQCERRRFGVLSNETCIVQIAKRDFKCGRLPHQFIPISSLKDDDLEHLEHSEHNFTFQMFGINAIQATWYFSPIDHCKILAGIAIFIDSPYTDPAHFSRALLWSLLLQEHNLLRGSAHCPEAFVDRETITKSLIPCFCKRLKQPVMLGRQYGLFVHMEWDEVHKTFQYCECEKCQMDMERNELEPPSYQDATQQLLSSDY